MSLIDIWNCYGQYSIFILHIGISPSCGTLFHISWCNLFSI
jgi:hypothetical protein